MNQLEFLETMSVEQFLTKMGATEIGIAQSRTTGKQFMTFNKSVIGAVASCGFQEISSPVVSRVKGDNGEFYLLHNERGQAPIIGRLTL